MNDLRTAIEHAINCHSAENGSDTPDFILAEYLTNCLAAYDQAVCARERWYGRKSGSVKSDAPVGDPPPSDAPEDADEIRGVTTNECEICGGSGNTPSLDITPLEPTEPCTRCRPKSGLKR